MREIKAIMFYAIAMIVMVSCIWGAGVLFSRNVEDIRVIEVEPGVHCAVTSRMFNTSIDCWKTDE